MQVCHSYPYKVSPIKRQAKSLFMFDSSILWDKKNGRLSVRKPTEESTAAETQAQNAQICDQQSA
ncbi:MAG TPA: hypothetical protein DEO65_16520 [Bacillus bacterium]|nr:hypothetical protein [Bacillus sp. (in: firmicutes)]